MNTLELSLLNPADLGTQSKESLLNKTDAWVASQVEEGFDLLGPLSVAAKIELVAGRIKDKAKAAAVGEVSQYGRAGVARNGVAMVAKETGVTYDYSGDRVWQALNQAVVEATQKRKQQEEFLKALPHEGRITMDEETGEEYRAYPPVKSASTSVQLTIQ